MRQNRPVVRQNAVGVPAPDESAAFHDQYLVAHRGDFGGIAVYLTSDASAYHTGDTFVIDGGYAIF